VNNTLPKQEEIKVMVDQLNRALSDVIVDPVQQNVNAAVLARQVVHAGLHLVFKEIDELRAELLHAQTEAGDACASLSTLALEEDTVHAVRDAKQAAHTLCALQSRIRIRLGAKK
jgi:hypothetical protein